MTSAARAFDYRELEEAGFTKAQTSALKKWRESSQPHDDIIKTEIDLCESRMESSMKDMELRLLREIHSVKDEVSSVKVNVGSLQGDIKLLKGIGYFIAAVVTLLSSMTGIILAGPKVLGLWH